MPGCRRSLYFSGANVTTWTFLVGGRGLGATEELESRLQTLIKKTGWKNMWNIITALITGTVVGFGGRAILPGAQKIGLLRTVGVGVVSAFIVGLVIEGLNGKWWLTVIVSSIVAAGLLWVLIKQQLLGFK